MTKDYSNFTNYSPKHVIVGFVSSAIKKIPFTLHIRCKIICIILFLIILPALTELSTVYYSVLSVTLFYIFV